MRFLLITALILAWSCAACLRHDSMRESRFVDLATVDPLALELVYWTPDSDIRLPLENANVDIIVNTRVSQGCRLKDLPLELEIISPKTLKPDTVATLIHIRDDAGAYFGRRSITLFESSDTIVKNFPFHSGMSFSLTSPLPLNELEGIKTIGIILSETP